MRTLVAAVLLSAVVLPLSSSVAFAEETADKDADDQTLFGDGVEFGGYGAPVWGMSPTQDGLVGTSGGRGGAILNERFAFGGHGNTSVAVDGSRLSYGGLFFEFIPWADAKVHPDFDVAWGSGSWRSESGKTPVQVVQGAVRAEANITGWFRVAAGPTVRMVQARSAGGILEQTVGAEVQARFGSF